MNRTENSLNLTEEEIKGAVLHPPMEFGVKRNSKNKKKQERAKQQLVGVLGNTRLMQNADIIFDLYANQVKVTPTSVMHRLSLEDPMGYFTRDADNFKEYAKMLKRGIKSGAFQAFPSPCKSKNIQGTTYYPLIIVSRDILNDRLEAKAKPFDFHAFYFLDMLTLGVAEMFNNEEDRDRYLAYYMKDVEPWPIDCPAICITPEDRQLVIAAAQKTEWMRATAFVFMCNMPLLKSGAALE